MIPRSQFRDKDEAHADEIDEELDAEITKQDTVDGNDMPSIWIKKAPSERTMAILRNSYIEEGGWHGMSVSEVNGDFPYRIDLW